MIGKTISHYRILEKLGEGGMGEVYLAEDTKLERNVALKFLLHAHVREPKLQMRFKREAKALAALNHPNIVTVYGIGDYKETKYIAMEYVNGTTLRTIIKHGELQIARILEIISEICKGLSKAHEVNIIHRDIKPENIIIDYEGRIRILDFGLAKVPGVTDLTTEGVAPGTICYMSPEQLQGHEVDFRTDTWSLGVLLYEMMTGSVPFAGEYVAGMIYSILHEEPKPPSYNEPGVDGGIQMIIEKALTKDLDRRYQNITDMLADLKLTESRVVGPGSQFVDSGQTAAFDEPHSRATDDEKCDVRKLFKNIKFGYAAAETEGSRAPELLQYAFLDQFGAVENTLSGNQFLLLGPKGSGKSAIAEKMRLIAETRQDLTVKIRRLSTFPYKLFGRIVAGKEEAQVRYPRAWDWLLLVTLIGSFMEDDQAKDAEVLWKVIGILQDNSLVPVENLDQLAAKSSKKIFRVNLPNDAMDISSFVEILYDAALKFRSKKRHILIIDGLDDVLISKESQAQVISALILAACNLNLEFLRHNVNSHVLILSRTDLFESLPNPNKNKFRADYAVVLDWYHNPRHPEDSGLIHLAQRRSQVANVELGDIFFECFPEKLEGKNPRRWLLDLTRHTPRDFLQLLTHIQRFVRLDSKESKISREEMYAGLRSYSLEYFLPSIKDSLDGFIDRDMIDIGMSTIGSLRKREFTLKDFLSHAAESLGELNPIDARAFLKALFQAGAIGNKTVRSKSVMYTFQFRNPHSSINYFEPFIVHKGLLKAWNLI